jgi:hypothetical protein
MKYGNAPLQARKFGSPFRGWGTGSGMQALKRFVASYWYKAIAVLSAPPFLLALTLPLNLSNRAVAMIAAGVFLIGVGEWINHPPPTQYAFDYRSYQPRVASFGGILMDMLGVYLLMWGLVMLLHSLP